MVYIKKNLKKKKKKHPKNRISRLGHVKVPFFELLR